ncbi:MBL fold metallo-hydrolase [Streptomyces sp. NPDC088732]|uniref:MBL fold metallo-hydrolase n=1 Tax=Streptomyces sp. NPDC088732 TaxID=3365879 RepID=UPI003805B194
MKRALSYAVSVAPQIPQSGRGPLPDGSPRMWSPISSTLISGERDAVLVDPPMTADQAAAVGDWIAASGRRLVAVYVTHGHGDHWFGAVPLLERFPDAEVRATPGTIGVMAAQAAPSFRESFWETVFPGQIPQGTVEAVPVGPDGFEIEGHRLVPVEAGRTDTDATTMLHVPDLGLLVAGDVVYNGVHPYLTESGGISGIDSWLAALDLAERLDPRAVVAGHKDPRSPDAPRQIAETRSYLRDARRLLPEADGAQQFFDAMLALHPDRINPGALWGAAVTLFPAGASS